MRRARGTERLALWAALFLSGAAALVYQVLWIRQLGVVVGATSYALAAVLATFMGGLALGSALAGRFADRTRSPLRAYAMLEVGVAAWALLVPPLLHVAGRAHRAIGIGAPAAVEIGAAVGLSALALLPATTMMGATLPLMSRHVARDPERRGRDLGLLYAINTLGAFVGVVVTGFWSIEALGLSATNRVAVLASVSAGAIGLALARNGAPMAAAEVTSGGAADHRAILAFAAAARFAGLAHEVVWNRLLSLVLLTTTHAYSTLLATVIVGIGLGSVLGARLADRVEAPERMFGALQLGVGVSALAILPLLGWVARSAPDVLQTHTLTYARSQERMVLLCGASILLPSVLMGATYPPLARAVTRAGDVGRGVGRLYAANTLGAVAGALVAGFALVPAAGVMGALGAVAGLNLIVGVIAIWPSDPRAQPARLAVGAVGFGAAALLAGALSSADLRSIYAARLPPGSRILTVREGPTSTVMVADHSEPRVRRLWIESAWVAGTGGTHRMLGHLPALHAAERDRAAGIAFGTGQSFAAARLHGLSRLDCVDLDPGVVAAGARWFAEANDHLLERPETRVHIADGRSFLARVDTPYDVIVMEPLQPWSAGTVDLYTREFYEDARRALAPGGAIAQWLPLHDVPPWVARAVVATFASVFGRVHAYLDNYDLCLIGGGPPPRWSTFEARVAEAPVHADLDPLDYGDPASVLSALVLGPDDVARYAAGAPLLEDDRPFLEFVAPRVMSENHFGANLAALRAHAASPLSAFVDAAAAPEGLRSGAVARVTLAGTAALDRDDLAASYAAYREAWRAAPEIPRTRALTRGAAVRLAEALNAAGAPARALAIYDAHLAEDPGFGGAWLNVGRLRVRAGDRAGAREAFTRATRDPETAERGRRGLELLGR